MSTSNQTMFSNKGFNETLNIPHGGIAGRDDMSNPNVLAELDLKNMCCEISTLKDEIHEISKGSDERINQLEKKLDNQQEMLYKIMYLLKLATSPEEEMDAIMKEEQERTQKNKDIVNVNEEEEAVVIASEEEEAVVIDNEEDDE